MSKLQVFDIFLDILHKMKGNLGQERVKGGFYPSRAKVGTISPDIPSFDPTFPPVPP